MAGIRNFFKAAKNNEDADRLAAADSMAADIAAWEAAGGKVEQLDSTARSQPIFVSKKARGAAADKHAKRAARLLTEQAMRDVAEALETDDAN